MKIERIVQGSLESNCYIIYHKEGCECYIIDPGYNAAKIIKHIESKELKPKGILLTHMHHDHVGAVHGIKAKFDVPTYMHAQDAQEYKGHIDVLLYGGEELDLEGETIKILHTPGHSHGSICIMCEESKACFTGDTIFDIDLGRTDFNCGSQKEMEDSIRNVISKWDNSITIYPGHDISATMKQVRKYNTEYLAIMQGAGDGN